MALVSAAADAPVARKVRGVLHQHLARAFRTAVGPPLKSPSRVREKVLRDRGLRATLEALAAETGRPYPALAAEAEKDLKEIASRYDPHFIQVARFLLARMFRRLYTSVEVDEAGNTITLSGAGVATSRIVVTPGALGIERTSTLTPPA